jgi:hypothetical protein
MKVEKLAELEIDYEISKMRRDEYKTRFLKQLPRAPKRAFLESHMDYYEKKVHRLLPQVIKRHEEIRQLTNKQLLDHNHMHGDSGMYIPPTLGQRKSELQQLKDDRQKHKDQLEDQSRLLNNLKDDGNTKKFNSDKKSYEKEIQKLKHIVERTQAKINIITEDIRYNY